jgi:acyl-CoA thioester hydrolase
MCHASFVTGSPARLAGRPSAASRNRMARASVASHSSSVSGVEYRLSKVVMPADTDYSGAMWHGAYVRWLEEARVRHLEEIDLRYDKLVSESRLELVVTALQVQYKHAARMGDVVTLVQRFAIESSSRVRLVTKSTFTRGDGKKLATAEVTVTPVSTETGRIVRRWPDSMEAAVIKMFTGGDGADIQDSHDWLKPRLKPHQVKTPVRDLP